MKTGDVEDSSKKKNTDPKVKCFIKVDPSSFYRSFYLSFAEYIRESLEIPLLLKLGPFSKFVSVGILN